MQVDYHCHIVLVVAFAILYLTTSRSPTSKKLDGTLGVRQGRWGMFFTYEPICTLACQKNGKYSGRLYGGVCRCYCPRTETDPCSGIYPSCDRLCRQNAYHLGGDCIDDVRCWCFCTVRQRQAPNTTVTTTGAPPAAAAPSAPGPASDTVTGNVGQQSNNAPPAGGTRKIMS